eukprot:g2806.t1
MEVSQQSVPYNTTSHDYGTANNFSTSNFMLAFLSLLGVALLLGHFFTHRLKIAWLSEASVSILTGMLAGGLLQLFPYDDVKGFKDAVVGFSPSIFFCVLLPPIIFSSGYHMKGSFFFFNMAKILIFAICGTFVSAWTIGFTVWLCGAIGLSLDISFAESLTFGALISATDPVTTLAIFQQLNVDPHLFYIVFGESVLNDAVSIVLFHTFAKFIGYSHSSETVIIAILDFILIFTGSTVVGVLCGCCAAFVYKFADIGKEPILELSLFIVFAYVPFLLGEWIEFSGIVAILFTGITMKHYTYNNMSREAREKSDTIIAVLANVAETAIFLELGSSIWKFPSYHIGLIFTALFACLLARAFHIYPLSWLINQRAARKISKNQQHMLWFSGLRGAIAYALAVDFPGQNKEYIISTTIVIVFATVIFLGGATDYLLNRLRIPRGARTFQASHERQMIQFVSASSIVRFDQQFLQPILLKKKVRAQNP